jgi:magnesium chelatase family protein
VLSRTSSFALLGVEALPVSVEVDVVPGLPTFTVVGLPDSAVRESRNRVASALANAGFEFPLRRITVNLAPGTLRKEGSAFDLPIALAILAATGQLSAEVADRWSSLGELSLTGELRPVRGVLCAAIAQRRRTDRSLLVPAANLAEARLVPDVRVAGAETLAEAVGVVRGAARRSRSGERSSDPGAIRVAAAEAPICHPASWTPGEADACAGATPEVQDATSLLLREQIDVDLSDVRGQPHAKRALEVAAAGGHNLLLVGPPGAGKSMLARRLPGILPPMSLDEILETTRIHSVAGLLPSERPVVTTRPFRRPHHTVSYAGLVGGGSVPRPGEVSLAHNGVLFLDELAEFSRQALEVLRQPMEEGSVTLARARVSVSYPARFMLVAAMNPCNCGDLTHPDRACRCSEAEVRRYRSRVSGPLLDRIDLHVEVPPVPLAQLRASPEREDGDGESAAARDRVGLARTRQLQRYAGLGIHCNGQLGPRGTRRRLRADAGAFGLLDRAAAAFHLSARAYHRTLRVARTIADLESSEILAAAHVAEALQYRAQGGVAEEVLREPQ